MLRKTLATVSGLLAVAVLISVVVIIHAYIVRPGQTTSMGICLWLPVLPPVIALSCSLLLWRRPKREPIEECLELGACVSSGAYMMLQIWLLATQFTLISRDGTAYWGLLQLPALYVALPLLLFGLGTGAVVGLILQRRLPNQ